MRAGTTGNYDTDGGAAEAHRGGNVNEKWQTALDIVKRFDGAGGPKVIIVKTWPGPFSMCVGRGVRYSMGGGQVGFGCLAARKMHPPRRHLTYDAPPTVKSVSVARLHAR